MNNKKLGITILFIAIFLLALIIYFKYIIDTAYNSQIEIFHSAGNSCNEVQGLCPHELKARAQIPVYIGFGIVAALITLSFYLIYFSKGEKAILDMIKETKEIESMENKFEILLKGLDQDEKKVLMAVKEQDGISQSTLKLRTDLSKSKLSMVLTGLEKKGIISKVNKGKINLIYLKEAF